MPQTFFADMVRLDAERTPVTVEYSYRGGEAPSYSPYSGADGGDPVEVEIIRAWRKADEDDPDAPDIEYTDDELNAWCDRICVEHIDEPDVDDYL